LVALTRTYVGQLQRHDMMGLAAELAFRFMFATFPCALFLAALGGFIAAWLGVSDPTARIISSLGGSLPSDLVGPVKTQLDEVRPIRNPRSCRWGRS